MAEKENSDKLIYLLEDDYFISSANHPTTESDACWAAQISEGNITRKDYELALHAVRLFRPSGCGLSQEEVADIWMKIKMKQAHGRHKRRRLEVWLSGVAASVLAAAGLFMAYHRHSSGTTFTEAKMNIENVALPVIEGDDVHVILSEKEHITVKDNAPEIVYDASGDVYVGRQTVLKAENESSMQEITYNQVIVPKGKRSTLTLSDGSKLYLNSNSRVVYPPSFTGKTREIFVEGEVFAKITHDETLPFMLKTNHMEISVLGTSFNVSDYADEASQAVVLVYGSVKVKSKSGNEEKTLKPNEMFKQSDTGTEILTVNVKDYISWKKGYYIYNDEKLSLIFKKLSRYYGIDIQYPQGIGELRFTGKLDLKEDISRIMAGFSKIADITFVKSENNTYHVKPLK
jgi:ferric-dicitrate binding protein FerR (iron transport regulator)